MILQHNYPLDKLNSFGVKASTKYFIEIFSVEELHEVLDEDKLTHSEKLILGGGSNILFIKNFEGLIIKNSIQCIAVLEETEEYVIIEAGAGVEWDDLVKYSVSNNYGGIENLSLIPGSVGAAPVQNIGAYGQELKDCFYELTGMFIESGEQKIFSNKDCDFSYRNSIFKGILKNKFIITSVRLKLDTNPVVNLSYQQVNNEVIKRKIISPAISDIREIVIDIRKSKLPDPQKIGNAGSFFKNPIIDSQKYRSIRNKYPDIKSFTETESKIKISAAWLIEKCGWKDKRLGDAGVHKQQPLVLVNYGSASGKDIDNLSEKIKKSVSDNFGINLENEVNII